VIEPEDWADQRPGLLAEREAADAEVARIREHADALADAAPMIDAEAELLRHLADLRAAVVDGIGKAPNLDATRTLLRRLFRRVLYVAPDHPWLDQPGFVTSDMPPVGGGYLMPDLHEDVVEFVDADGNPYFNDVPADATPEDLGPFDPDEPDPIGIIHEAVLPLEQPLREGLLIEYPESVPAGWPDMGDRVTRRASATVERADGGLLPRGVVPCKNAMRYLRPAYCWHRRGVNVTAHHQDPARRSRGGRCHPMDGL
jgi:hypothetical protein